MKNSASDRNKLILSMLIFGSIGVVRRYIPFPSSVVALARAAIGLIFLLLVRAVRKEPIDREAVKRNLPKLIILGALLAANWIFLFEAYNYTSVAAATMCYYMAPVFVMLLSPVLFGERMGTKKALCAVVAIFGMVLVSGIISSGVHGTKGIVLGLIAAAMYAAIIILNKTLKEISAGDRTIMQFLVSVIVMLPYVLLTENVSALEPTPFIILMLLVAGVIHTGLTYTLYFGSISGIPAQTAALLSYIDPVVAVILSVTLLKEPMSIGAIIGAVLVIGAMIVSEMEPKEKASRNQ